MFKSHRNHLAAIVILAVSNSTAIGQTINLVCNGTVHQSQPNQYATAAGGTTIDFERERIATPVGVFHIFNADETSIAFDDPGNQLKVFGYLDRLTGKMTVMWRRPEEEAKMQAGLPSQMSMYAELGCSVSKRLF